MRWSKYERVMTGSGFTAPAVKGRWLVLVLIGLVAAVVVFPRAEATTFVSSRAGLAAGAVDLVADTRMTQSSFDTPERVGWIHDPAVGESSGLVGRPGSTHLWTINDSGNPPRIYCMYLKGSSCGTWDVAGATNEDWEGIAAGPGPDAGLRYLYIGDIGNNARSAKDVVVYRVVQPDPSLREPGINQTSPSEVLLFVYPDGVHDAEALLVHPRTGDLYIIAKEADGGVYKASAPFDASAPISLERVARLSIFSNFSDITGADISPDGRHVAVSTYGGWYELSLPLLLTDTAAIETFDRVWNATPARIGSLLGRQWETIAYRAGGRSLFMTSEGVSSAIYRARRGES